MNVDKAGYADYMARLGQAAGVEIKTFADIRKAMNKRIAFFEEMGCRATDHALEYVFCREADEQTVDAIIAKALKGESISKEETEAYKTLSSPTWPVNITNAAGSCSFTSPPCATSIRKCTAN